MARIITAAKLKRMRGELKLTIPAFAKEIGCGVRYYTYREQGQVPIKLMFSRAVNDAYRDLKKPD